MERNMFRRYLGRLPQWVLAHDRYIWGAQWLPLLLTTLLSFTAFGAYVHYLVAYFAVIVY